MKKKWEALGWKQKNVAFGLVLLVFSWIAYNWSIKGTWVLANECEELRTRIDSAEIVVTEITASQNELDSLNQLSGETTYITHEQLLGKVSACCVTYQLKLRAFPEVMRIVKDDRVIEIHSVTVEGGFDDIVLMAEQLRSEKNGRIVSLDFFAGTDTKTKQRSLSATFYIQCITNSSS